jgi:hypothetical protein
MAEKKKTKGRTEMIELRIMKTKERSRYHRAAEHTRISLLYKAVVVSEQDALRCDGATVKFGIS